jgi:hypothetical protein
LLGFHGGLDDGRGLLWFRCRGIFDISCRLFFFKHGLGLGSRGLGGEEKSGLDGRSREGFGEVCLNIRRQFFVLFTIVKVRELAEKLLATARNAGLESL